VATHAPKTGVERAAGERRRAERRQVHVLAKLRLKDERVEQVLLVDISSTGVRLRLPRTEKLTVENMRDPILRIRVKTGETTSVVSLGMRLVRVPKLTDDFFDLAFEFRDVTVHLASLLGHLQSLIFE
jgi:hypothetical protein